MKKMKIGYVVRLYGVSNRYAWGETLAKARIFRTREYARQDKRDVRSTATRQEIYQIELTRNGRPKRIIKKVR